MSYEQWFLTGFGSLILVMVVIAIRQQALRRKALQEHCTRHGFEFHKKMNAAELPFADALPFFKSGSFRRYRNVLFRETRPGRTWIFDFSYTTGAGRSRRTWRQTVLVHHSQDLDIAPFECEPGGKIASFLHNTFHGQKDIDFESDPDFSSRYILHGCDERACRRLFESSGIRRILVREKNLHLQAGGNAFAIFRKRRLVKPDRLLDFCRLGEELYASLR